MENKNFYLFKEDKKVFKKEENSFFIKNVKEIEKQVKTKETAIFLFDQTYEKTKKKQRNYNNKQPHK